MLLTIILSLDATKNTNFTSFLLSYLITISPWILIILRSFLFQLLNLILSYFMRSAAAVWDKLYSLANTDSLLLPSPIQTPKTDI